MIAGVIDRPGNFYRVANDETTARCFIDDLPDNNCPREWVWMVKDYIWEMIPVHNKENVFRIKLVADDKPDMYLFYHQGQDKLITGGGGDEFDDMFEEETVVPGPLELQCPSCGGLISITTTQRPIQVGCPMCQSQFVIRE